ncbi:peptidylprolyl isomerase [Roseivivax isoporae]|uniref:Peptidyl-prolyl cis-trans isomerase n=1 Tax=Roseivivax isoporae LMG 25204 TaxID=1449351 RepID=X7F5E8_9RHOB|nr:peptidylprolyl isomerase [Roseivivax isoporae]ETX27326.1 peptidyl-prolyl cis-trans isomerase [Roseivivax isoporae LMG 25204]
MALKAKGLSKVFVWILMGLLFLGLIGFGATNITGNVRSVGSVGDEPIPVDAYSRALQQEISTIQQQAGQAVSFADLQAAGVDRQVLSRIVVNTALDWEARRIGLSVGDEVLAGELARISAFQGPDGAFDRDAYRFALQNAGLSEQEFETDLRQETARSLLQGAILSATAMPDTYVDTLVAWANETRDFSWAILDEGALSTGVAVPTEEQLRAYYDENIDRYTRPETKVVSYAWVTPDMLVDSVEIDEETLRRAYEEREAEFNMPERRLVERLVFGSEEEAQAAAEALAAGETDFDTLVADRGLTLADVDLGVVDRGDLGEAASAVFGTSAGDVAGPAPSPLGPALFRVNAELAAQSTPFEEAVPVLRDSLVLDRARRVIDDQAEDFDDRLVGGATLEDLAAETDMVFDTVDYAGQSGDGITSYPAFREAVADMAPGDYPEILETGDGGLFAARVDEIQPEAPRPFEEVRDQVETGWERQQITEALTGQAEALATRIAEGESFEAAGLEPRSLDAVTRNEGVDGLPEGAIARIFALEEGEAVAVPGQGRVAILRLDAVVPADTDGPEATALAERLRDQASGSLANDLFSAYATDIQNRAGVQVDQQALNAVHSNLQ